MSDLPIIDAHTHVHPTMEAAHRFMSLLNPELTRAGRAGSVDEALVLMDKLGIATTLILPWVFAQRIYAAELAATGKPADTDDEQLKDRIAEDWARYNAWATTAVRQYPGRFAAMCAVDPILLGEERTRVQIERGLEMGAIGLKIVPGYMNAYPHDPRMEIVWREAERRGLSVTAQCSGPADGFAWAGQFEDVLRGYPNCRVVMAHMGLGGGEEEVVRLAQKFPNAYADTSSWLGNVGKPGFRSPAEAADLFRRIGIDRVLFGTNYPLTDPADFVRNLHALPLTEPERRQVAHENAERVHRGIRAGVA
jgi:uncharacterized protein